MARPPKRAHKLDVKLPLRISAPMQKEMKTAADKMGTEDAEALRMAASIGFRFLRRINYDINGLVIEKALGTNWRSHG